MKIDVLEMIDELRDEVLDKYSGEYDIAGLAVIQVGDDPASNLYVKSKTVEAKKWRIDLTKHKFSDDPEHVEELDKKIRSTIEKLNSDPITNGIIIQLPLPDYLKKYEQEYIGMIKPDKNVDGFKQYGAASRYFTPCTPAGIMYILHKMRDIRGKTVCLIGRGKTVGEPLIDILSKEPCTLICCNSSTEEKELPFFVANSDIIITAVGKPGLFSTTYVSANTLIIDAGISYVDGKQTGDYQHVADTFATLYKAFTIDYTPHIGGVGKMTVAMLMRNTIDAMELQKED